MKLKLYHTLLFIMLSDVVYSQKSDECLGQITYTFKIAYEKANVNDSVQYLTTEEQLFFGKTSALRMVIRKGKLSFDNNVDTSELFKNKAVRAYVYKEIDKYIPKNEKPGTLLSIKKYNSKILVNQSSSMQDKYYIFIDTLPKIEWILLEEKASFLGYTCQKAIGSFRGRNYTAWFTSEISVPTGPWKLYGLPGLILSVNDDKKEVFLEATKIEIPLKNVLIPEKLTGKLVTFPELVEIRKKEHDKYVRMGRAAGTIGEVRYLKTVELELKKE